MYVQKHVMQQKIEQLKEEVKQKEGQIEEIHTKYQEMLRYLVKFHEYVGIDFIALFEFIEYRDE